MALFKWKDELSVNVNIFNHHHKKLVGLINELHEAVLTNKAQAIIERTLKSLHEYTKYHFSEEEKLMAEKDYPNLSEHKVQHEHFIKKVRGWIKRCEEGDLGHNMEVMSFLREWLSEHIMGTDKKYTNFFNARGVI